MSDDKPTAPEILMGPGNNQAECQRCREVMEIPLPMPIHAFGPWVAFAQAKHEQCRPPEIPAQPGQKK